MNKKRSKTKMGRPPKSKDTKQGERVSVNMTREEREALAKDAAKAGMSLAAYLLDCWKKGRGC
jgi:Mobilization protein NikA